MHHPCTVSITINLTSFPLDRHPDRFRRDSTATSVAVRGLFQAEACRSASHPMSCRTVQRLRELGSSSSKIFACTCTPARSAARLHQRAHASRLREIVDHSQQRHVHSAAAAINHVQNAAIRCPHKRPQRSSAGQHVPVSWRCASQRCVSLPPSPTRSECQREASQVTIERMRAVHLLVRPCLGADQSPEPPRAHALALATSD